MPSKTNLVPVPSSAALRSIAAALRDALNLDDGATIAEIRDALTEQRTVALESFEDAYLADFSSIAAYILAEQAGDRERMSDGSHC